MTLINSFQLKNSEELQKRVATAMIIAARDIINESISATNHDNRIAWAKRISKGDVVEYEARSWMWMIILNPTINSLGSSATDNDIQNTVNSLIDYFSTPTPESDNVEKFSGFVHITNNIEDAIPKLIENSDVFSAAGITESKLSLNYPTHQNTNLDNNQNIFISILAPGTGNLTLTSGTAYFVYLGETTSIITPRYVECHILTAGAGGQTAELGIFSTPLAPNKAGQTLTRIVATGTVDSLTSTGVKRNTNQFNTQIPIGTHIWAGIRTAMATTQPRPWGFGSDMAQGQILSTTASGTLTGGTGNFSGAIIAATTSICAPDLRITLT